MTQTKHRGLFITLEGIDGCGKTLQTKRLKEFLEKKGYSVVVTREPGGTRISEKIRSILLDPELDDFNSLTEIYLYLASRAQHVAEIIFPVLNEKKIVVSDRFADATFAYQGFGRGLSLEKIKLLNRIACQGVHPDITFLLDIPVQESVRRSQKAGKTADRLEQEGNVFLNKVRQGYERLAREEPRRIYKINGVLPIEEVQFLIEKKMKTILDKGKL